MEQPLSILRNLIDPEGIISHQDWDDFKMIWKPFSAKRKEVITYTGQTEKYLYYVTEGVQRVYYYDEQGREATVVFTYAPSFGGVLDSLILEKPSRYTYETLTPSNFLRANAMDLFKLMDTKPLIQKVVIKGLSETISGMMERMVQLQCFTSEDKFRTLLKRSPHILQLVPHKYLANYIGIDPTNFSKMINKVKI